MLQIKETKNISQEDLLALYTAVGWNVYSREPEQLSQAVKQSLCVITAWEKAQLVGLIRAVGDGISILYIQDLLVSGPYQNQGIGSQLMNQLVATYPQIRQKVLLTDENPANRHFYEKCGFTSADQKEVVAFYQFHF